MTNKDMSDYLFYEVEMADKGIELQELIWHTLVSQIVDLFPTDKLDNITDFKLFEKMFLEFWVGNFKAALEHKLIKIEESQ